MPVNLIQADWVQTGDVGALVIDEANGDIINPVSMKVASRGTAPTDGATGAVLSALRSAIVAGGRQVDLSVKLDDAATEASEVLLWAFASPGVDVDGVPDEGILLSITSDPNTARTIKLQTRLAAGAFVDRAFATVPGVPTNVTMYRVTAVVDGADYLVACDASEDGGVTFDRLFEFTIVAPSFTETDWRFAFNAQAAPFASPALTFIDDFVADDGTLTPPVGSPFPFTDDFQDASWD